MEAKMNKFLAALGAAFLLSGCIPANEPAKPARVAAQKAEKPKTAVLINGLGVYGNPGMMGAIQDALQKRGWKVTVISHVAAKRLTVMPRVLIGHSMGANAALKRARIFIRNHPDLIVSIDAGPEYSSCLAIPMGNDAMIVTGTRKGLVAINARNGALLWGNDFSANNTANCPTPAYADGHVFWANGYNKGGICLRLAPNGMAAEAWRTKDMNCHHGGYIIDKGYIYGNDGDGWTCLDLKTGQKKWQARLLGKGSLCWADSMLYLFGEKDGQCALTTCSPDAVEIKNSMKVDGEGPSWAYPVVIGGRLYLRYDTNLYCFDVKTPPKSEEKEKDKDKKEEEKKE